MPLLVQKFGGSSVGTVELVRAVAARIHDAYKRGCRVVVVVSAMQGDTDRLLGLAHSISCDASMLRERAALLATGEQQSAALLAMALISLGVPSQSLTASQAGIITRGEYDKGVITAVNSYGLSSLCDRGIVPVVTGFQGVNAEGDITNIGRGGSDLTAVALAHWLKADQCHIYTDVDGVFTVDPRVVGEAKLVERVSYDEMLELAKHGAKVLQYRAVEYAMRHRVPVWVAHSQSSGNVGTLLCSASSMGTLPTITGIGLDRNQASFVISSELSKSDCGQKLRLFLEESDIEFDMFMEHIHENRLLVKFTTHLDVSDRAKAVVERYMAVMKGACLQLASQGFAKLSLIGLNMSRHADVVSQSMRLLQSKSILVAWLSSYSHRVSLIVPAKDLEQSAALLHSRFVLTQTAPV